MKEGGGPRRRKREQEGRKGGRSGASQDAVKLQSGGTNATAKQLLVSVGRSMEEEERA